MVLKHTTDFINFTVPYNELSPRIVVLSKFFVALTISSKVNCLHTGKSSGPNLDVSEMCPNHNHKQKNCKSMFFTIFENYGFLEKTLLAFESISDENPMDG